MQYPISVSCTRTPIKFCSTDEDFVAVLLTVINYDTANTLKIGDLCALRWLIFAGPVTYCILVIVYGRKLSRITFMIDVVFEETFATSLILRSRDN